MKDFPDVPAAEDASKERFEEGHLWLYELVDGTNFRFQLTEYGAVHFGDRQHTYDPDAVPLPYGHAVRHVREHLDRDALQRTVDDVTDVVFFGVATHRRRVDYDWERLPSFLGFDVWDDSRERFLPPEAVDAVYRRLGLDPLNTVAREVNTRDFDPSGYELPDSAWYDGPAAGVHIRNKRGGRAQLLGPRLRDADADADRPDATPSALARRYATDRRLSRVVAALEAQGHAVTFDAVYERLFECIVREESHRLVDDHSLTVDAQAFRSALADIVGETVGRQP